MVMGRRGANGAAITTDGMGSTPAQNEMYNMM